jgi:hypothetical protein
LSASSAIWTQRLTQPHPRPSSRHRSYHCRSQCIRRELYQANRPRTK